MIVDANGEEYKIGDIVLNPCICDYWVVQECTSKMKEDYGLTTDLCFALNNDPDDYVVDIDEPQGFIICMRIGDKNYNEAINELNEVALLRRKRYGEEEIETIEDE